MPLLPFAQPVAKARRVGFLASTSRPAVLDDHYYGAFSRGMRELGYVEGKNLLIEYRFADGNRERLESFAAELVRLKVDVILAAGGIAADAAQNATSALPIVIGSIGDAAGAGFVTSLARPNRNITGISNFSADLAPKYIELLVSVVPKLSRVAVLANPTNPYHALLIKNVQEAARKIRVTVLPVEAKTQSEIEGAFATMKKANVGAVIVARDALLNQQAREIADLAAKNRLPSMAGIREYVDAGCLMSYGNSISESYRRAATYVDKILKGAKPADLPVEQPTKLMLTVNLKTAKALGITIPQSVLTRSDEVIQ